MNRQLMTLCIAIALPAAAAAGMYKWVDADGNVIYSQTPPPQGVQAETIGPPPAPPPGETERAKARLEAYREAEAERRSARETASQGRAADAEITAQRAENCAKVRHNLEVLRNRPPHSMFRTADGDYKRFTPEEMAAEIEKQERLEQVHCGP
jgi:hypothetical protein